MVGSEEKPEAALWIVFEDKLRGQQELILWSLYYDLVPSLVLVSILYVSRFPLSPFAVCSIAQLYTVGVSHAVQQIHLRNVANPPASCGSSRK